MSHTDETPPTSVALQLPTGRIMGTVALRGGLVIGAGAWLAVSTLYAPIAVIAFSSGPARFGDAITALGILCTLGVIPATIAAAIGALITMAFCTTHIQRGLPPSKLRWVACFPIALTFGIGLIPFAAIAFFYLLFVGPIFMLPILLYFPIAMLAAVFGSQWVTQPFVAAS